MRINDMSCAAGPVEQIPVQNRLLKSMPAAAFTLIGSRLKRVPLKSREILQERNRPIPYVYFVERGVASVFARTSRDGPVEVAMIGRLGLVGVPVVLGTMRSPNRCLVMVPGEALRISSGDLKNAIDRSSELRQHLMNYVQALLIQNSQTVLCNVRHELCDRLCRWLLLACDRLDDNTIPVTHDLLSMTLGVRRAGVTAALAKLAAAGAVRRLRGAIEILDRDILEQRACECYRIISAEYKRLTIQTSVNASTTKRVSHFDSSLLADHQAGGSYVPEAYRHCDK
jgi:CRP-like cAMP-binding protein